MITTTNENSNTLPPAVAAALIQQQQHSQQQQISHATGNPTNISTQQASSVTESIQQQIVASHVIFSQKYVGDFFLKNLDFKWKD